MVSGVFIAFVLLAGDPQPDLSKIPAQYRSDPRIQEALKNKTDKPKTCVQTCEAMEDVSKTSCENAGKKSKNPAAEKGCKENMANVAKACKQSCEAKGKIDGEYMKEHTKMPAKPQHGGGKKPAKTESSDDGAVENQ
jgi:hypothetical protein